MAGFTKQVFGGKYLCRLDSPLKREGCGGMILNSEPAQTGKPAQVAHPYVDFRTDGVFFDNVLHCHKLRGGPCRPAPKHLLEEIFRAGAGFEPALFLPFVSGFLRNTGTRGKAVRFLLHLLAAFHFDRNNSLVRTEVDQAVSLNTPGIPHGNNPAGVTGSPVPGLGVGDFTKQVLLISISWGMEQHSGLNVIKPHSHSPFLTHRARA